MNFFTTIILILSVVYIIYIAFQLRADYKKSRPLEGQSEEHFVFDPDNPVNVNSVKVTMDQNGISLVPEEPVSKVVPSTVAQEDTRSDKSKQQQGKGTEKSSQSNNNSTQPSEITSQNQSQTVGNQGYYASEGNEGENAEEIMDQLNRKMLIAKHTMRYMGPEFNSDELMAAINRGDVETEVVEELEYEESEDNDYDNDMTATEEETIETEYDNDSMAPSQNGEEEEECSEYHDNEEAGPDYQDSEYPEQEYEEDEEYYESYDYNQDDDIPEFDEFESYDSDQQDLQSDMESNSY